MTAAVAIVRADGEGERRRFWGGGILTMKATADETGGAFLLFDDSMAQGKTTPLHIHADEDEGCTSSRARSSSTSTGPTIASARAGSRWRRAACRTRSSSPRRPRGC